MTSELKKPGCTHAVYSRHFKSPAIQMMVLEQGNLSYFYGTDTDIVKPSFVTNSNE